MNRAGPSGQRTWASELCGGLAFHVTGEVVQNGLPARTLLLFRVRLLRFEGFPHGDASRPGEKFHPQGAPAKLALDQLMVLDLRIGTRKIEPHAAVLGFHA